MPVCGSFRLYFASCSAILPTLQADDSARRANARLCQPGWPRTRASHPHSVRSIRLHRTPTHRARKVHPHSASIDIQGCRGTRQPFARPVWCALPGTSARLIAPISRGVITCHLLVDMRCRWRHTRARNRLWPAPVAHGCANPGPSTGLRAMTPSPSGHDQDDA
jgi:hypothetical protein